MPWCGCTKAIKAPLALTVFQDQVTYMVMGRAISAAMGTATVLVVYFVGKRVSSADRRPARRRAAGHHRGAHRRVPQLQSRSRDDVLRVAGMAVRVADRRPGALARLPLGGRVRRGGDRIQVLGRVHPRRRRRRASGRATPSADVDGRPWLARVDRSRAESARRDARWRSPSSTRWPSSTTTSSARTSSSRSSTR